MIIPFGGTLLKLETSIYDVGVRNDAGGESPRANTVVDRGVLDRPLLTWQARRSSDAKGAWGWKCVGFELGFRTGPTTTTSIDFCSGGNFEKVGKYKTMCQPLTGQISTCETGVPPCDHHPCERAFYIPLSTAMISCAVSEPNIIPRLFSRSRLASNWSLQTQISCFLAFIHIHVKVV